jgi:hypothetical protein
MELVALLDAGWSAVALESLQAAHRVVVEHRDDSCLALSSASDLPSHDLLWAKSVFTVLARTDRDSVDRAVSRLAGQVPKRVDLGRDSGKGFRVVVHIDGALRSVDSGARSRLESSVARASGARVARRGGGAEVWVLARRDSPTVWLLNRLSQQVRRSPRGSLSAELSSLLCLASHPDPSDVFLDPFAGTGSIPSARRSWPARAIYAGDQAQIAWPADPPRDVTSFTQRVQDLPGVVPPGVSVVVSDPPWNEFVPVDDFDGLLSETCEALARVADPKVGLRTALLMNRRNADRLRARLERVGFGELAEDPVLVNGHPASVVTGRLRSASWTPHTGPA